jgi:carboxyl-terminal processing protease
MATNKKPNATLPLLFSIAVAIGMLIGYKLHSNMPMTKSFFSSKHKNTLDEVIDIIQKRYADSVSSDSINQIAIETVLSSLDPHSNFIPVTDLQEMNEDLEGRFEGIGIEFNIFNDTVHVLSVMKNGPAENARLKVGDRIIKVNDSSVVGLANSDQFRKWVKGPGGTPVNLELVRDGVKKSQQVIRGSIPITSVDAHYMINKEAGYIRLNRFSGNTYKEFMQAMENLKSLGLKKLILDLRDNGGGVLEESVEIADEFISGDKLLVFTQGVNHPKKEYRTKRPGIFEEGEVIILMNEGSASASEVLAGALQDHDRARIVGNRSFGKGLVQEQFSLSDGSALRLTTARYYTPLGRSIQKSYETGTEAYHREALNRMHGSKQNEEADSLFISSAKSYKTPKGKVLYDGKGIMPDRVVERDQMLNDSNLAQVFTDNLIGNFAYRKFIAEKDKIIRYKSQSIFLQQFDEASKLIPELFQFGLASGKQLKPLSKAGNAYVTNRIKAQIARIAWDESAFFYILNSEDPVFKEATQLLQ